MIAGAKLDHAALENPDFHVTGDIQVTLTPGAVSGEAGEPTVRAPSR